MNCAKCGALLFGVVTGEPGELCSACDDQRIISVIVREFGGGETRGLMMRERKARAVGEGPPIREYIKTRPPASNSAGVAVTANQADGVKAGGYVSADLGKGGELEVDGGISSRQGWGITAWWRKVWGGK